MIVKCKSCEYEFKTYPSTNQKYCSRKCRANGLCNNENDFWVKVEKSPGCWVWNASLMRRGYGVYTFRLGHKQPKQRYRAHRFAWELINGPIPDGFMVCHSCDNKKCVRPDHLFLGTAKDNTQDALLKNRGVGKHINN